MSFQPAIIWEVPYAEAVKGIGTSALRKVINSALVTFDALIVSHGELKSVHRCRDAFEKIRTAGFEKAELELRRNGQPEDYPNMIRLAVSEHRPAAIEELQSCVWRWATQELADAIAPELKRCFRRAAEEVRAEIAEIQAHERKLAAKYAGPEGRSDLIAGLEQLASRFEADAEKKFTLDWHWRPRLALNAYFKDGL